MPPATEAQQTKTNHTAREHTEPKYVVPQTRVVQLDLLALLEDVDQVRMYGWGSSCLAFLYRHLGYASRRKAKQMGGFLILLGVHLLFLII
jgi:hypothetical protein